MPGAAADRNLLFGILAVQMDFVAADGLVAAMNRWVLDKRTPLGAHLVELRVLSSETRGLLEALVDRHIEQHGGQAAESLSSLGPANPLVRELSIIADADVQSSLAHAALPTPRNDRHATLAMPQPREASTGLRFTVLRPHASGGLGKVSIARDGELNREVALKELHDRLADNPNSRARFLQEAEITGGLEHPGVVPIYGLGHYADGRPFYAMRFIRGDSLATAIERFHRLAETRWTSPTDVLRLRRLLSRLIEVCNAVEYAHSRGVLHRDLKPSNVMLGAYGETIVVDWGLAKALGKAGAEPSVRASDLAHSLVAEPALTPQSGSGSSPTMMGSAVGTPAFMSPEQAAGRLDQLGPTTDVYSLGATLYMLLTGQPPQTDDDLGVVLQRVCCGEFTPPRTVKPAAPRGLEAICLKAMAFAPKHRYVSARRMAEDLEAWLADEPVTARPESWVSRTWRWVKKHRTLVTSGAAVLLMAAAASSLAVVVLSAANQRERDARRVAVTAKTFAEEAQTESERQATRNTELLALARKSLARYEVLSNSEQLNRYGMEGLRRDLQEAQMEYFETLAHQQGETEDDRAGRAQALSQLGGTYWALGKVDKGLEAYDSAVKMFQQLEKEFPDNPKYQRGAGNALLAIGEQQSDLQRSVDAEQPLTEARRRFEVLNRRDPKNVEDAAMLAYGWSLEGERLRQLGQMPQAADIMKRGIAILKTIDVGALTGTASRDFRYRLGRAYNQLGAMQGDALWQFADARETFRQSQEVFRKLYDEYPANGDIGFSLAQSLRNSGFVYSRENEVDQARQFYLEALAVLRQVEARNPDVPHYRQEMAAELFDLGMLQHPLNMQPITEEALAQVEEAVAIAQRQVEMFPQDADRKIYLARYESALAGAYAERGREEDARKHFEISADLLERITAEVGDRLNPLYTLGTMHSALADHMFEAGRIADSLAMCDKAEALFNRLTVLAPEFLDSQRALANVYSRRSYCFEAEGRLSEAIAEFDRVAAKNTEMSKRNVPQWMQQSMTAIAGLTKAERWTALVRIREGALHELVDRGDYELAATQARMLPRLSSEVGDHYVAAETLAYIVLTALVDKNLAPNKSKALADALGGEAVAELTRAWEGGYIRRKAGIASLFSSTPTLDSIRSDTSFAALAARPDFVALLKRIETEEPPQPRRPAPAQPAGGRNSTGDR